MSDRKKSKATTASKDGTKPRPMTEADRAAVLKGFPTVRLSPGESSQDPLRDARGGKR